MFEYIQGESGVNPLTQEFVDAIFDLAKDKDILTIADEVQTGVGRTGKFLAGMHYGKKQILLLLLKVLPAEFRWALVLWMRSVPMY